MDEIRLNLTSGAEALEKQARELQQQAEQRVQGKQELSARLTRVLGQMGYPPPVPTPFVTERALETVVRDLDAHPAASDLSQAIESRKTEMHHLHEDSY